MTLIDTARQVRAGEELDAVALAAYLRTGLGTSGGVPEIRQYPSGYSNLTYELAIDGRKLVLRRPPFGTKAKTAHDMGREYRVLSALHPVYPLCPRPLAFCADPGVIGAEFYVMEHIGGLIIRKDYPAGFDADPQRVRSHFLGMIDALAGLHQLDYVAAGLGDLGRPAGYTERQVTGWTRRYVAARTEDAPAFDDVMDWLARNQPPDAGRAALIHNDFKLDNVIWDPDHPLRLIGVLDWEMCTLGDPVMDLAGTLGYWVEPDDPPYMQETRLMPTDVPGAPTRREVIAHYERATGHRVEPLDFYLCFGWFRLAVVGQQLYYRFHEGKSRDPRLAQCADWVRALECMCQRVIRGKMS
ncbi:MAG TPA: phosphotransferase family protein [Steroidobacteraceae bacterium]|nr:phosphotransferase family protein [Steroidobacteraceae bacterium]